ncbi:MAG: PD-(D/E)XK nuclease family protein [Treponemataceae bacterium]|nr:PD-(D/E)XK nuclease family protein [Treponemataceae bacterium]
MGKSGTPLSWILAKLSDRQVRFVFPSSVVARFWAELTARETTQPLDLRRFLAWDTFKEEVLSVQEQERRPANRLLRLLFAASILKQNEEQAAQEHPLFTSLIPPAYASDYQVFVPLVAELLPSLKKIRDAIVRTSSNHGAFAPLGSGERTASERESSCADDPYYQDLILLYQRYDAFLTQKGFFEPSWQTVSFHHTPFEWILFFPELLEDWDAYQNALPSKVIVVPLEALVLQQEIGDPPSPVLEEKEPLRAVLPLLHQKGLSFPTMQEEIRFVVLLLQELLRSGTYDVQDIVLSVPELEVYREPLELESALRDVPLYIQQGKPIADLPGGRFFVHMQQLEHSSWSYEGLRYFLEDGAIPWKKIENVYWLLEFGKVFRCFSGFEEKGKNRDTWLETFEKVKHFSKETLVEKGWNGPSPVQLEEFYKELKRHIRKCLFASSFQELKKSLDEFIDSFVERTTMDVRVDPVFAIAQDELEQLIRLERSLTESPALSPYALFIQHLRKTPYVPQRKGAGIRVYPYRVTAGIYAKLHIIMNAAQDSLSVAMDDGGSLREDKKMILGLKSKEVSTVFFRAYLNGGERVIFTVPRRRFDGRYAIPYQFLEQVYPLSFTEKEGRRGKDDEENRITHLFLLISQHDPYQKRKPHAFSLQPPRVMELASRRIHQRNGSAGRFRRKEDFRQDMVNDLNLLEAIKERFHGEISPLSLNQFLRCPYSWFLQQALKIQAPEVELPVIAPIDEGKVYHAVLEGFLKALQAQGPLQKDRLAEYQSILDSYIHRIFASYEAQEGPFEAEIFRMRKNRLKARLHDYLKNDIEHLANQRIVGVEFDGARYSLSSYAGGEDVSACSTYYLTGRIDLLTLHPDGFLTITDFKRGHLPKSSQLVVQESASPAIENQYDIQLAAYIKMVEATPIEGSLRTVRWARLYSLEEGKFQKVVDPEGLSRQNSRLPLPRDSYESTLDMVDWLCDEYIEALERGVFPVPDIEHQEVCTNCPVRSVCRIPFSSDRFSGQWRGYNQLL